MMKDDEKLLPSEYLEFFGKPATRSSYQLALRKYLEVINGSAVVDLDTGWAEYLEKDKSEIIKDLLNFDKLCSSKNYAPHTFLQYLSTAERYLREAQGIELRPRQKRMRKNRLPKHVTITRDIALDTKMINKIISGADNRLRAEILIGSSGGLRIGEIINIELCHIDDSQSPTKIYIPHDVAKNGIARFTFISDEATEAYHAWMDTRDKTLAISTKRRTNKQHHIETNNPHIFPYTEQNEIYRLDKRLKKIGLFFPDPNTGRSQISSHSFRKFFITQFGLAASKTVAEALAGHEGYLDSAYRRIPEAEMRAEYLKAMPRLMINVPEDYIRVKIEQADEIAKLQISAADQQHLINQLLTELRQMRKTQDLMNVTGGIVPLHSRSILQNDEYEAL